MPVQSRSTRTVPRRRTAHLPAEFQKEIFQHREHLAERLGFGLTVVFGEDGQLVGADLVGRVAVGGNAVGADDDGLDARLAHGRRRHRVADQRRRNLLVDELEGCQPRALIVRPAHSICMQSNTMYQ